MFPLPAAWQGRLMMASRLKTEKRHHPPPRVENRRVLNVALPNFVPVIFDNLPCFKKRKAGERIVYYSLFPQT
jgi:hypothetical protein